MLIQNRLSVTLLDDILKQGLTGLFKDICGCDWYVREREIVNLFVFSQLVPLFQKHGIDITTIGIEFPAMQVRSSERSKFGARKDLAIWPEARTTLWKGCDLSNVMQWDQLHKPGCKPLAIVEWKNISRITAQRNVVKKEHQLDIKWLQRNCIGGMMTVGYTVLVDQSTCDIRLSCRRISADSDCEFLVLPAAIENPSGKAIARS